ncbi:ATP-binding protein [Paenibacillus sp. 1P07SE]|uniref:hybrid sensor histidine kinase/response regulator n=1 Tax=Paenibacillus sp. 1P07SE TaxID=3132209 RepID=UPI0039A5508E
MGKRYALIILASIAVVISLPLVTLVQMLVGTQEPPHAREGVLDLRDWDFGAGGVVPLVGEWEFYRSELLLPGDGGGEPLTAELVQVPGKWNGYIRDDGQTAAEGFATFRLRILLPEDEEGIYGLHMKNIRSASRIFLDNTEIGASGMPGQDSQSGKQRNVPFVGYAAVSEDSLDVMVQVANYSYSSGGMISPILFGDQRSIIQNREFAAGVDWMSIVGLFIPACLFILVSRLRKSESAMLYLGLFCLGAMIYVMTHGEKLLGIMLPGMDYYIFMKIQFSCSVLVYYFLLRYVAISLPGTVIPAVSRAAFWVTIVMGSASLLLPPLVFSQVEDLMLAISFMSVGYVLYAMLKGLRQQSENLFFMMISIYSILAIILINILALLGVRFPYYLTLYGILLFVFAQGVLMALRYAASFREVEQLSERLLTLDGLKDEFMANTSHELRTPLHGIVNMAQTMLEGSAGPLSRKQAEHLSMVVSTGKRLSALIDDILDFAKLRNGDIEIHRKPVDLKMVASSVVEVIRHVDTKAGVELQVQWPDNLPMLDTDEDRLHQVLFNLLGNALKFTDQGSVTLSARAQGDQVIVSIADTGIGIKPERLLTIFDAYDQGGSAVHRSYKGTGLGLSITRKLIELNGGRIWVESVPGEGSVFRFSLPVSQDQSQSRSPSVPVQALTAAALAEHQEEPVTASDQVRSQILVVDDDPINLQVLINALSLEKHDVIPVRSGGEALQEITRNPAIDLVITDWMMPEMSGLELCRHIREDYLLSDLPVLMLTARSRAEDSQTAFASGANDYLSKPVDLGELRARVRTLLKLRQSVKLSIQTEVAYLQAQIKPHFLYNAMNTIISICYDDPAKAIQLLFELSQYLRSSFDFQNRDQTKPLAKELELVKSYLALEQARFDDLLNIVYDIDESVRVLIPPLSIQPIVENAVRHGVMQKESGGTVKLSIRQQGTEVEIEVQDDGVGMPPDRAQMVLSGGKGTGGVGLRNIHKRLQSIYGTGLAINTIEQQGTTIRFRIPAGQWSTSSEERGD